MKSNLFIILDIGIYKKLCHACMNGSIGIFDSGVGGLTVYKAIRQALPNESLIYLGDTARVPYGTKSAETVIRYSLQNAAFLKERGIKALVVACNTSSAYAIPELKKMLDIPVIGVIEPGVKAALKATKSGRIGVVGTKATIASGAYARLLKEKRADVKITSLSCPLFVPLVEEGWLETQVTRDIAKVYLEPFARERIDTLILGCTHYPLLKKVIGETVGEGIKLVDSGESVADALRALFADSSDERRATSDEFYVTDMPSQFELIATRFLGNVPQIKIVSIA